MEVVSWDEVIEPEAEETEESLRPRRPRQHSDVITASRDDNSDKSSRTSTDESRPSDDEEEQEKTTNGKPSNGASHADGNGDAKSTNGHSKLDDRYVDFLVSEQNPAETVSKSEEIEPEESVSVAKPDNAVEIEVVDNALSSLQEVQSFSASNETVQYMEAELRKKIEAEFRELYLDKLSDRQGKHEFYCPNCKACITKVLVREAEVVLSSEPSAATEEPERVVQRRFRCTSCFSFLDPIGHWLFPKWKIAGEDEEESIFHQGRLREPLLDLTSQPAISKTPVPREPVVAKVTEKIETHSRDWTVLPDDRDIHAVLSKTPEPTEPSVTGVTATIETMEHNTERVTAIVGSAQSKPWASVVFGKKLQGAIKDRIPVTEEPIRVTVPAKPTKPSEEIKAVKEQALLDDAYEGGKQHYHQLPVSEFTGTVVSAEFTPLGSSVEAGVKLEVSVPSQELKGKLPDLGQSRTEVIVRTKPSDIDVVDGSTGEVPSLQEVIIHRGPKPDATLEGLDEGLAGPLLPDSTAAVVLPRDTGIFTEQDSPKSWEVVKSLVYGGLVESITSLGIVTSAASGDASTLNIVVLALANLIGGLFVIAHNIWELRDEQSTLRCSRTNRLVDKYHEVLGRRENFPLHATCVILSFLIFGLIPPVVYGLTFRASSDKDLKLAAVGVASMICIAIMAVGKAYIQKPNKYIKTIFYYLVIGFGVSGASYLAGKLIKQLLEKISLSESTLALAVSLSGPGTSKGGWGSY